MAAESCTENWICGMFAEATVKSLFFSIAELSALDIACLSHPRLF